MSRLYSIFFFLFVACIFACSYVTDSERRESWEQIRQGAAVIDVRSEQEFAEEHFEGALHMPYQSIGTLLPQQIPDRDTPIVVYCTVGGRSGIAKRNLVELGYTNVFNAGGLGDIREFELANGSSR